MIALTWYAILVAVLAAAKAVLKYRDGDAKQYEFYIPLAVFVISVLAAVASYGISTAAEEKAAARHEEQLEEGQRRGELLHPHVGTAPREQPISVAIGGVSGTFDTNNRVTALGINTEARVSVRRRDGAIYVSATVVDENGEPAAIMKDNQFLVANGYTSQQWPNRLIKKDPLGKSVLDIRLVSETCAHVDGVFYARGGGAVIAKGDQLRVVNLKKGQTIEMFYAPESLGQP